MLWQKDGKIHQVRNFSNAAPLPAPRNDEERETSKGGLS